MGRGDLEYRSLDVAGVRRGYWLARGPDAAGPLLMVLHGSGMSGKAVATTFPGWPGGPQFLPARIIGPILRHLDATGILLEMVTAGS
jgi:hypothetical protein